MNYVIKSFINALYDFYACSDQGLMDKYQKLTNDCHFLFFCKTRTKPPFLFLSIFIYL